MIRSFRDRGTEDLFDGGDSGAARRACPPTIWNVARRKLAQLDAAVSLRSLSIPVGNSLEALKHDRTGQHAIRVNAQYRVCFRWTDAGPEDVEITDYH